jgi:heme/copper-type cytochrome/quinol oxidase subunit 1
MPRLSRWFVRSALIYLLIGFGIGGLILCAKAGYVDARVWVWLLPHADFLLVGWLIQLAMGVAYWILPRMRETGRGRVALAWIAYFLLNAGLCLGAGLACLDYWFPDSGWNSKAFIPGLLTQAIALCVFVIYAWPRVLPTITAADWQRKTTQPRR